MEGNLMNEHGATANIPKYVFQRPVLHQSSAVNNPKDYGRALLSAFQFSQPQTPSHSHWNASVTASFGLASEGEEVNSRRINPFPVELTQNRNEHSDEDNNTAPLPLEQRSIIPAGPAQQVGASASLSSSSPCVNLDALSRQIMMAGIAALGMNNPALQRQFVLGENNASNSNPFVNLNNFPVSSIQQESSVNSSVPDGSGLLRYRAPEIESFIFDRNAGYRFDPTTGLHYDANTGFFINVGLKIFMRWDPICNTYLREHKRQCPPQNVPVYPSDVIMRQTANSANDLLGPQPMAKLMGKSVQDGYADSRIPADMSDNPVDTQKICHEGPFANELQQLMKPFKNEGDSSKINKDRERASELSDSKKRSRDENDRDAQKRTSRSRSSSRSLSDSPVSNNVREGLGKRPVGRSRSRSVSSRNEPKGGFRKRKSVSRGRKRSRSHSREAKKRRRPRYNDTREGRRSCSSGVSRSQSRGRRRSCSQSPRLHMKEHRSRSGSHQRRSKSRDRVRWGRCNSKGAKKKADVWSPLSHSTSEYGQKISKGQSPNSLDTDSVSNSTFHPHSVEVESGSSGLKSHSKITSKFFEDRNKKVQDVMIGYFECGNVGHFKEDCPESMSEMTAHERKLQDVGVCFSCGKLGHYKKDCIGPNSEMTKESSAQEKSCQDLVSAVKCGEKEHYKEDCREEGTFCCMCHKICDHIGAMCPLQRDSRQTEAVASSSSSRPIYPCSAGSMETAQTSSSSGKCIKWEVGCFKCGQHGHKKEECEVEGTKCLGIDDHIGANCPVRLARRRGICEIVKYQQSIPDSEKRRAGVWNRLSPHSPSKLWNLGTAKSLNQPGHKREKCKGTYCNVCRKICDHKGANCPVRLARKKRKIEVVFGLKGSKVQNRSSLETDADRNSAELLNFPLKHDRCYRCGNQGHTQLDCKVEGILCYGCNEITDHVRKDCPKSKGIYRARPGSIGDPNLGLSTSKTCDGQNGPNVRNHNILETDPNRNSAELPNFPIEHDRCYRSGSQSHTHLDCKVEGILCYECNEITDHVREDCPKSKGIYRARPSSIGDPNLGPSTSKANLTCDGPNEPKVQNGSILEKEPDKNSAELPNFPLKHDRCYRCGSQGHTHLNCKVEGILCYGCNKITDHVRKDCPKSKGRYRVRPGSIGDPNLGPSTSKDNLARDGPKEPKVQNHSILETEMDRNSAELPNFRLKHDRCYRCGNQGHTQLDCKVEGILCYGCNKITSHVRKDCPKSKGRYRARPGSIGVRNLRPSTSKVNLSNVPVESEVQNRNSLKTDPINLGQQNGDLDDNASRLVSYSSDSDDSEVPTGGGEPKPYIFKSSSSHLPGFSDSLWPLVIKLKFDCQGHISGYVNLYSTFYNLYSVCKS